MSRKDTILITVIINAGLLAILFVTAIIYETEPLVDTHPPLAEAHDPLHRLPLVAASPLAVVDEVDQALKYHNPPLAKEADNEGNEPLEIQTIPYDETEAFQENPKFTEDDQFLLITVKKGDVLEKIAKTYHTTVSAIKKANQLPNERLSIGQNLKIPKEIEVKTAPKAPVQPESNTEANYYTVKQGDNPWKIAKQFNVGYEEILRLNHLDEEKAKNLRVGDRVRVK